MRIAVTGASGSSAASLPSAPARMPEFDHEVTYYGRTPPADGRGRSRVANASHYDILDVAREADCPPETPVDAVVHCAAPPTTGPRLTR
jgi:nucleoside-diphosphate-sugar epimerase